MFVRFITRINERFWISDGAIINLEIKGSVLVRGKSLQQVAPNERGIHPT